MLIAFQYFDIELGRLNLVSLIIIILIDFFKKIIKMLNIIRKTP